MYVAERNSGAFHNKFITFSGSPELVSLQGSLRQRYEKTFYANVGLNTNFEKAYMLTLETAQLYKTKQENMPSMLLCLSDMQFDAASNGRLHLNNIQERFEKAGYKIPKLIFWNLREAYTGTPALADASKIGLVSGFSLSIMSAVLACKDLSPMNIVCEIVKKYKLNFENLPTYKDVEKLLKKSKPKIYN